MKSRKIAYVLMILSFIMIISGGIYQFTINLKADKVATYKRMDDVSNTFENFSTNTSTFEAFRDELYNEVLGNVYFETMATIDAVIKNKLSNYENLVDELEKNTIKLDKLCDDVYYPSSDINSKCYNYKSIYEQVVNYFVSDIEVYNTNIEKYNNYQVSVKSNLKLENYKTEKKYIDYNGDKNFDGKEEK